MAISMTGFGRGEYGEDNYYFTVDVRSVNHRYSDFTIRLPKTLLVLEDKVREYASSRISRGKVDIYINYDSFGQEADIKIDTNLVKSYIDCLTKIKDEFNINDEINLSLLTKFTDIFKVEKIEKKEEEIWNILKIALEKAFEALCEMKEREGERLSKDIKAKLDSIRKIINDIDEKYDSLLDEHIRKFRERIIELTQGITLDENRLMTEIAIIADKSSIDEEIVRLKSHIDEFEKTLCLKSAVGRKLDFLVQEMNREINTIGSKAVDICIINNVVDLKTQIEKIREQIQNLE